MKKYVGLFLAIIILSCASDDSTSIINYPDTNVDSVNTELLSSLFNIDFSSLPNYENQPIPSYIIKDNTPISNQITDEAAILGRVLFYDTSLSTNNTISCSSCHDLYNGGDDGLKFSFGIHGQEGDINSPTVLNAAYNFRQFWDGRASTLLHQTWGPVENPVEMGNTFEQLIITLNNSPYKKEFNAIYKGNYSV